LENTKESDFLTQAVLTLMAPQTCGDRKLTGLLWQTSTGDRNSSSRSWASMEPLVRRIWIKHQRFRVMMTLDLRSVEYRCLHPSEKDKQVPEQLYSVWCGRVKDRRWRQTAAGKTGAVLTGICILPLWPTLLSELTSW